MMNIGERLKYIIDYQGLNYSDFGKKYKIEGRSISDMVLNKRPVGGIVLKRIYTLTPEINIGWLLTGIGEPFIHKNVTGTFLPQLEDIQEKYHTDTFEKLFIENLQKPASLQIIIETVKKMIKDGK